MNAYTTTGQARIQSHDLAVIMRMSTGSYMAAASLAALERQRGWQAETEVAWLLKPDGAMPQAHTPVIALLRQRIGVALLRAGERLASVPGSDVSLETSPRAST